MEIRERDPTARMYDSPVDELVFNKVSEIHSLISSLSSLFPTLHNSRLNLDIPLNGNGIPPLVKDALSLANSVRSHTSKNKGDNNYKVIDIIISYHFHIHQMLSPRFAPVLPDKYEGRGLLSPSVLAFYKVHFHYFFSFYSSF